MKKIYVLAMCLTFLSEIMAMEVAPEIAAKIATEDAVPDGGSGENEIIEMVPVVTEEIKKDLT